MQILPPGAVAPCDDIIRENGSKLEIRSDFLNATVRNKTTDSEIKPFLLDLFSITSSRFQQNPCPVKSVRNIAELGTIVLDIPLL